MATFENNDPRLMNSHGPLKADSSAHIISRLQVLSRHLSSSFEPPTSQCKEKPCCSSASSDASCPLKMLSGKVAIITGAGQGIGAATAKLLASHGAKVVVGDLDLGPACDVAAEICKSGGEAVAVAGDVTEDETPKLLVEAAVSFGTGSIDIVINNAGFTWDAWVGKTSTTQWRAMMAVHAEAPLRLVQAAESYMRLAGAAERAAGQTPCPRFIVNVSSVSGTHGNAGQVAYASAKSAVSGLTKTLAREWGPFGVRCNAVAFGLIQTRLTSVRKAKKEKDMETKAGGEVQGGRGTAEETKGKDGTKTEDADSVFVTKEGHRVTLGIPAGNDYWATVKSQIPLGYVGSPEEAAGALFLLVQPYASYITGQVLEANGGSFM